MTVVAWDGRRVAADSQETTGCSRSVRPTDKLEIRDGIVYAVTGVGALHKPLIDWVHNDKADPEKRPPVHEKYQDTCVIMWKEGRCFAYDLESPYPSEHFAPEAWGCEIAASHAIGAMDSGIDAKTAVERAIIRNTCVGGPVQVIDLNSLKAEKAGSITVIHDDDPERRKSA